MEKEAGEAADGEAVQEEAVEEDAGAAAQSAKCRRVGDAMANEAAVAENPFADVQAVWANFGVTIAGHLHVQGHAAVINMCMTRMHPPFF